MTPFVSTIASLVAIVAMLTTNATAQGMIRGSAMLSTNTITNNFNTAFYKNLAAWRTLGVSKTSCYNMTYQEYCWPCEGGEIEVVVRDNQIVVPSNGQHLIKTMDELFDLTESQCVMGCPGSADGCSDIDNVIACEVGYTTKFSTEGSNPSGYSYISSFSYRMNERIADGGYFAEVRDLRFCDEA